MPPLGQSFSPQPEEVPPDKEPKEGNPGNPTPNSPCALTGAASKNKNNNVSNDRIPLKDLEKQAILPSLRNCKKAQP